MARISKAWIPGPVAGIQYNTCKTPKCAHFGCSPEEYPQAYRITYGGKSLPLLQCVLCGEVPPIKSNQGIADEVQRLIAHTLGEAPLTCPGPLVLQGRAVLRVIAHEKGARRLLGVAYFFVGG